MKTKSPRHPPGESYERLLYLLFRKMQTEGITALQATELVQSALNEFYDKDWVEETGDTDGQHGSRGYQGTNESQPKASFEEEEEEECVVVAREPIKPRRKRECAEMEVL
ncbi:hypothetical protein CSIM01_13854 [Colletotrichum simmondsii]|uniref:Uncharacterized protein n=1 Tax=Colletotrichum simmondsii TaxID=703756 RepID=A0A135S6S3_9PEZI|nr:hypothetical protein CSIM01_13854 [Colletotrichum simmondsii]